MHSYSNIARSFWHFNHISLTLYANNMHNVYYVTNFFQLQLVDERKMLLIINRLNRCSIILKVRIQRRHAHCITGAKWTPWLTPFEQHCIDIQDLYWRILALINVSSCVSILVKRCWYIYIGMTTVSVITILYMYYTILFALQIYKFWFWSRDTDLIDGNLG